MRMATSSSTRRSEICQLFLDFNQVLLQSRDLLARVGPAQYLGSCGRIGHGLLPRKGIAGGDRHGPESGRVGPRCIGRSRKSTEHNLDLAFTSLDAQREACEAYIRSQAGEGWRRVPEPFDDGGLSGASLDRPALQALLAEVRAGKIDVVVVYKVDRLTRSLADFAKLIEIFDAHAASFVSVTQSFNTTTSMGRLTLNILLSLPSSSAR
jgi:hypothetical protein